MKEVTVACPHCGELLAITENYFKLTVSCPYCEKSIYIDDTGEAFVSEAAHNISPQLTPPKVTKKEPAQDNGFAKIGYIRDNSLVSFFKIIGFLGIISGFVLFVMGINGKSSLIITAVALFVSGILQLGFYQLADALLNIEHHVAQMHYEIIQLRKEK